MMYLAGDRMLMEQAWNTLEQVEQVNLISMKSHNGFSTVLCYKNMLQKVLC